MPAWAKTQLAGVMHAMTASAPKMFFIFMISIPVLLGPTLSELTILVCLQQTKIDQDPKIDLFLIALNRHPGIDDTEPAPTA